MQPITLPGIEEYALAHTTPDPPSLLALAAETQARCERPHMMVGPVEARFLQFLVWTLRPRAVLEIGTFTGYSALSMAGELPLDGHIVTCELSQEHADIARKHIATAGHDDRITVVVGPAMETIRTLPGPFDLILLDADQAHFPEYLDELVPKLTDRGVLAVDNTLWSGAVLDPSDTLDSTEGIRRFNDLVAARTDLISVLLSVRDGLTLIRRAPGGTQT
ncbi:O-methyltransferase [Nonomuraea sp. NPDC003804]|uniref:O-methyltransferase n=1 Tax=Nonomuraea sp. NPDC003804 TaxID=3154547 RepID=UPI0033A50747